MIELHPTTIDAYEGGAGSFFKCIDVDDLRAFLAQYVLCEKEPIARIHTCSYYCSRPECIKAQRDQMRNWIYNTLGDEKFQEMMWYKKEEKK